MNDPKQRARILAQRRRAAAKRRAARSNDDLDRLIAREYMRKVRQDPDYRARVNARRRKNYRADEAKRVALVEWHRCYREENREIINLKQRARRAAQRAERAAARLAAPIIEGSAGESRRAS